MSNDEEIVFGADEEPAKDEADNSSVEDAASEENNADAAEAEEKEEAASEADNELEARYMSLFAEYDNYRKRTQKEKDNLYADAIASVTKEFLTLLDNVDRATDGAKKADENSQDFIPCDGFLVKKRSYKNKEHRQDRSLHDLGRTDRPTGFVGVNPTGFQSYNHNA